MKTWINENGDKRCEPDCADEWLQDIEYLAMGYDGMHSAKDLMELIDELVEMSKKARECLWNGNWFSGDKGADRSRYISLERLLEFPPRAYRFDKEHADKHFIYGIESVLEYAQELPTADVAPVVPARWIISSDGYYPYCSHCHAEPENGKMTKFCSECGARMD